MKNFLSVSRLRFTRIVTKCKEAIKYGGPISENNHLTASHVVIAVLRIDIMFLLLFFRIGSGVFINDMFYLYK